MALYLKLLGPPQLWVDGRPVPQTPRKAGVIVAYLAMQQSSVERSRIADLLWEGDEESVRRNLRQELFRLKGTPWEGVLLQSTQYLSLGEVQTDCEDFLKNLASGAWSEALALWRGGFLHGLDPKSTEALWDWLIPERERWDRLHHEAVLGKARTLEAHGQYAEAIRMYQEMLLQDPLQEAEQLALIRLEALRGDRSAALRQYENYRSQLIEHLGLAPSSEMQALFERLKGGLALDGVQEGTRPKVLAEPPLVGRTEDWAWLETHWGRGVLLLRADSGVGKSRLALEFAQRKGEVLRIFQRESSAGVGFGGLLEVIRQGFESGKLNTLEAVWRNELSQLLPELERRSIKRDPGPTDKIRLFEAAARTLQLLVHSGGVVLWEDLHWLDWASLEFFPYLARRANALGLFILATARNDLWGPSPVQPVLRELERENKLFEHSLKPLQAKALVELVRTMSGQKTGSERFAERLFTATDGNVFFVLETLRHLFEQGLLRAEEGVWRTPFDSFTTDYRELPIPPSVRATLVERLERLGEGAATLVQAVALVDFPINAEQATVLSENLGLPIEDLEALVESGFLRFDAGTYTLRHELTRQAVLTELSESRKRWLHARIADALQTAGGTLPQLAWHLEAAGQRSKAYQAHLQAGRSLRYGPLARQALEHYSKAQTLIPPLEGDQERFRVLLEAAETRVSLGQTRFSERHQLSRLEGSMGASERFRLRLLDADTALASGQVSEGIAAAREALSLVETPLQRGHALFKMAWLEYRGGDPDDQLEPLQQAIQAFHETGDQSMEALALRNLSGYWFRLGDLEQHNRYFARSWGLAAKLEDGFLLRRLKSDKANVDWVKGEYQSSLELAQALYREARDLGDGWAIWDSLQALLHNAAVLGLDPPLEALIRSAIAEAAEAGAWRDLALLRSDYGAALLTENRLLEAKTELSSALRDLREMGERANIGHTLFFLGYTLLELRESEQSQALLEEAVGLWASRKEYRHQARALAGLTLARMRLGNDQGALEASQTAMQLIAPWALGLYDVPLINYARARILGTEAGRELLLETQQNLRQMAVGLPEESRRRFENNRFVVWALSKRD